MPRTILGALLCFALCIVTASGQAASEPKPQLAEEVFKNVQVLKGISVNEFMGTMGFFAASLSLNCTDCHVSESSGDWGPYAADTPLKKTARRMIVMVNDLNKNSFGGRRAVTCYSCHRGTIFPKLIPNLAEQYSSPPADDPNEIEIIGKAPATVSAEQILDKYIQALGGAQRLADLSSFVVKGTYQGTTLTWRRSRSRSLPKRPVNAPLSCTCALETAPPPTTDAPVGSPRPTNR